MNYSSGWTHRFHRWLINAENFEREWRKRNERNFAFYDGDQWSEEEKYALERRGQQPTQLNMIRPTVDLLLSIESEKRADIQVLGRNADDMEVGDILTSLLKQVRDQSNADFYESKAFREAIIGGRGWLYADIGDKKSLGNGDSENGQIYIRYVPWEEVLIDPYHRLPDGTDARFIIRKQWVDRDVLKKKYPKKADDITLAFNDDYHGVEYHAQIDSPDRAVYDYYDVLSGRVMICHCWYKDAKGKVRYVLFSQDIFLEGDAEDDSKNETPAEVDCYPLVPFTAFTRQNGVPQGLVEHIIDYQVQINKLNSKYLWDLSCNRLIIESDALETSINDIEDAALEWSRPNGVIVARSGGLNKIRSEENLNELQYLDSHLQMLLGLMQRTSGVNDSMMGLSSTNERSATQQSNRILQGSSMQTQLLENMHFAKLAINKVILQLIAKHYTKGFAVRILQPNQTYKFEGLNQDVVNEYGEVITRLRDIKDILRFDVILTRVSPFSSLRERQLAMFTEAAKSGVFPPEIVGRVMLNFMDIPHKQDIIAQMDSLYQQQAQLANAQKLAELDATVAGMQGGEMM